MSRTILARGRRLGTALIAAMLVAAVPIVTDVGTVDAVEYESGGFITFAQVDRATATVGHAVAISASVNSISTIRASIAVEVHDRYGRTLFQKSWSGELLKAGRTTELSTSWVTTNVAADTYTVKIGVSGGRKSSSTHWNDRAASITLNAPAATTTTIAPTTTTAPTTTSAPATTSAPTTTTTSPEAMATAASASPSITAAGEAVAVSATIEPDASGSYLVDVYVFNASGEKVFQFWWDNESFTAGKTKTLTTSWTTPTSLATGTYTLKVGLFETGWGPLVHWNDAAGTMTVSPTDTTTTTTTTPGTTVTPLRWAAPDTTGYTTYTLPSEGGRIDLKDSTDYVLVQNGVPATDGYSISGGRNIVWIGGHLTLNSSSTNEPRYRHRALTLWDNGGEVTRTIHVEGLLIEGNAIAEGINIDAPTATVQLQKIWMDAPNITSGDDRDGTGPYTTKSHPDVLQTYGGFAELRVDQFSALAGYQGIFLKVDHPDGITSGKTHLSNVSLEAVDVPGRDGRSYTANRLLFWTPTLHDDVFVDNVWLQHSVNASKVASTPNPRPGSGSQWLTMYRDSEGKAHEEPVPGNAVFTDAIERYIEGKALVAPLRGADGIGTYLTYSHDPTHSNVRNLDGTAQGKIYAGLPSGEHFVSKAEVGFGYTSPGYNS